MGGRFNKQQKSAYVSTYLFSFLAIFSFVIMNHIKCLWPNDLMLSLPHISFFGSLHHVDALSVDIAW